MAHSRHYVPLGAATLNSPDPPAPSCLYYSKLGPNVGTSHTGVNKRMQSPQELSSYPLAVMVQLGQKLKLDTQTFIGVQLQDRQLCTL